MSEEEKADLEFIWSLVLAAAYMECYLVLLAVGYRLFLEALSKYASEMEEKGG